MRKKSSMQESQTETTNKTIMMLKEKLNAKIQSSKQKKCMIYPNNELKSYWDGLITLVLLFSCMTTPYRIAFTESDTPTWKIINAVIDSSFAVDIVLSFMTAYHTGEY